MDNDKNALTNRMSSTQSIVHSLESQLSKANKIVRKHQEDLFEKESEISKVKLLLEESEKSKGDLQTRLEERLVLCGEMEEANNKLHDDIGEVQYALHQIPHTASQYSRLQCLLLQNNLFESSLVRYHT